MVEVNLLPWRAKRKQYEIKHVKQLIATAGILSLLVIAAAHLILLSKIKTLNMRVIALQDEMLGFANLQHELEEIKKRNEFSQQLTQILFEYQSATNNLLIELVKAPFKNVCFSEMSRESNVIEFSGYARSAEDLTIFLTHWSGSRLFSEIKIADLRQQIGSRFIRFRFQAIEKNTLSLNLLVKEKIPQ